MKFGKTTEELSEIQSRTNKALLDGVKKFAFLPVKIITDEYVWGEYYYEYRSGYINYHNRYNVYSINDVNGKIRRYQERKESYIKINDYRNKPGYKG